MGYTVPLTAVSNTALTASQWNASMRDNMLETPAAKFTVASQLFVSTGANAGAVRVPSMGVVATLETTASTTYTDLATAGPNSGGIITGPKALVGLHCYSNHASTGVPALMSFAVSGASTIAAADAFAIGMEGPNGCRVGSLQMIDTLTPGNNTFTAKYRTISGTATFQARRISVIPL